MYGLVQATVLQGAFRARATALDPCKILKQNARQRHRKAYSGWSAGHYLREQGRAESDHVLWVAVSHLPVSRQQNLGLKSYCEEFEHAWAHSKLKRGFRSKHK